MDRKILFASGVIVLALGGAAAAAHELREPGRVDIQRAFFLEESREGTNLTLSAILFVTCEGGSSTPIRLVTFVVPRATGIAGDRSAVDVGRISCGETREIAVPIRVAGFNATAPGSWAVEFLVFEDGLLTMEGHGNVGTRPYYVDDVDRAGSKASLAVEAEAPSFDRT
ncbi:MAG: hypothetical protein ACT4PT_00290 [Methanobacteriota archaeon]